MAQHSEEREKWAGSRRMSRMENEAGWGVHAWLAGSTEATHLLQYYLGAPGAGVSVLAFCSSDGGTKTPKQPNLCSLAPPPKNIMTAANLMHKSASLVQTCVENVVQYM
ncbi:hypothetical protein CesoFtcFv8_016950 [Champsocephalus esox]|uniref:Uncharacterized protein n=1 Tax=Champsocephalus esox TaxID=159716 RepID=A0AAN8BJV1_9TELE|nr:hypothetical protein CesoFtcFv8_016950 [Champsocephalus esox]